MKYFIFFVCIISILEGYSQKIKRNLDYPKLSHSDEIRCWKKVKDFVTGNLDSLCLKNTKIDRVDFNPEESAISTWENLRYNSSIPTYKKDSLILELSLYRIFFVVVEFEDCNEKAGSLLFYFNFQLILQSIYIHYAGNVSKIIWNMPYRKIF
jgi:hypothetical protein